MQLSSGTMVKLSEEPMDLKPELKAAFHEHFIHDDYKMHLTNRIQTTKYDPRDSVLNYITRIRNWCYDLDPDMSEQQTISYILK